jgi:hypothetical protein
MRLIGLAPVVLTPSHLAGILVQVDTDIMVLADPRPGASARKTDRLIGSHALVMMWFFHRAL